MTSKIPLKHNTKCPNCNCQGSSIQVFKNSLVDIKTSDNNKVVESK